MTRSVVVIDYGAGNLRSVVKALEHVEAAVTLTDDPWEVRGADRVILPGQGHFGQCMTRLETSGLGDAVREFVASDRPFLGVCVGMQLLFAESEEARGRTGFGFIPGVVRKIRTEQPLPHVGWNEVVFTGSAADDPLLDGLADAASRYFYHVHSYAAHEVPVEDVLGWCEYDDRFATLVGRDNVRGVQFHPEKSQEDGLRLLGNFLRL